MRKHFIFLLFTWAVSYAQTTENTVVAHFAKAIEANHYAWFSYPGNPPGTANGQYVKVRLGVNHKNQTSLWEEFSLQENKWIPIFTNTAEYTGTGVKYPSNSTILTKIQLDNDNWFALNDGQSNFTAIAFEGDISYSYCYTYLNYGGGGFDFFKQKDPKWYVSSGGNGLDIATGLTNIDTKGKSLEYEVRITDFTRVCDDAPDFILTQISQAPTQPDYVELQDANGNRIGNRIELKFQNQHNTPEKKIGDHFLIRKSHQSIEADNHFDGTKIGTQELFVLYFKLSDFGITKENYKNVAKFVQVKGSSEFDSAFFAYDKNSILFNRDFTEKRITLCKNNNTELNFSFRTDNGVGPYRFVYTLKKNDKIIGDISINTTQKGNNVTFSYPFQANEEGVFSFEFKSVTDMGNDSSIPENFVVENIVITVLPELQTLTKATISPNPVCLGNEVSINFALTSQTGVIYSLINSSNTEVSRLSGDGKNTVKFSFTPTKNDTYAVLYAFENKFCQERFEVGEITTTTPPSSFKFEQKHTICKGSQALLTLSGSEPQTDYLLKDANNNTIDRQKGTGNPLSFSVAEQGIYHITTSNNANCEVDMEGVASVQVIDLSSKSQEVTICQSNTTEKLRRVLEQRFTDNVQVVIYKNDILVTDFNEILNQDDKYSFILSSKEITCIGQKTDIHLTLTPAEVNSDFLINVGGSMPLRDYPLSNGKWHSSNEDIVSVTSTGIATGKQEGKATVFFTDVEGCVTEFQIEVKNECEITAFNYVSSNQDKENDYLFIKGIECFPDNELSIFNRWGSEVSHIKNYNNISNFFSGKAQQSPMNMGGSLLPSGVYYATLKYTSNGTTQSKSFWIYIKTPNKGNIFGF